MDVTDAGATVRLDDLSPAEVRVLGCLVEKEATTPDNYPLTLNSLRNACNQTTSRDPVVSYEEHEIELALAALRVRGLTRTVHSTSNRATKYRHVVPDVLGLDPAETAVLSVLLLRGPQTIGELKTRTERQHPFASTDEVAVVLGGLSSRPVPLALQLERQPGQKDARWVHLLAPVEATAGADAVARAPAEAARSDDPYGEATAEFYDLLATGQWETFGVELLDLLDGVDASVGPIVDVGAGTGVGLPYLLAAVPGARVHAVEPSKAMRTALHARLSLDERMRAVVTVDPRPLAAGTLPPRACAIVLSAVLGHLGDGERDLVWRYAVERMPAGAPIVVELLPPYRPETVAPTRYRQLRVGDFVYEGWLEGVPADDRHMSWTMTYRVLDGDATVAEYRVRSQYRCWSFDDLAEEVGRHGLHVDVRGDVAVVRR